jgi:hypothetical protein
LELAEKQFGSAELLSCLARKEFGRVAKEFCLAKLLSKSAGKEFGLVGKECGQAEKKCK